MKPDVFNKWREGPLFLMGSSQAVPLTRPDVYNFSTDKTLQDLYFSTITGMNRDCCNIEEMGTMSVLLSLKEITQKMIFLDVANSSLIWTV